MAASVAFFDANIHNPKMDHEYARSCGPNERMTSFVYGDIDHQYAKTTPIKNKRKHNALTPTGLTPQQASKKQQIVVSDMTTMHKQWTMAEKQTLADFVDSSSKTNAESDTQYWNRCADYINNKFPDSTRTGRSCKSAHARLSFCPQFVKDEPSMSDRGTQTTLCLLDSYRHNLTEHTVGEWVFMEPKKELKEGASKGAEILHSMALRRMRQYPDLKPNERAHLIKLLCTSSSKQVAAAIFTTSLGEHIQQALLSDLELQTRDCATHSSVLHQKQYKHLAAFSWDEILEELAMKQTFLLEVLLTVALPTGKIGNLKATESAVPVIGSIYGMLMKESYHELSRLQRVVTMSLANEQVNQKVYDRLQPMGVTLSHDGMSATMTSISGSFNDALIDAVKAGKRFRLVGDNINFTVSVSHERKSANKSVHMEHWFGFIAIIQNLNCSERTDETPQCNLLELPVQSFIMNDFDWYLVSNDFKVLVARTLTDFFPCLKFAKDAAYQVIPGDMPVDMKKKNQVIPLSVMHNNEQKYAEVIDILDYYQTLCESVYQACGKEVPLIQIGGDQLTRERFYGAKRLRAAAFAKSERFENLSPITFELFHLQMTVLNMFYDILYNTSGRVIDKSIYC